MRSRSWARSTLAGALLAAASGFVACGDDGSTPTEGSSLTIYVSLPLSGSAAREGTDAGDGARLALSDGPGEIGGYTIDAEFLDAGGGERGWTPAAAAANARVASHDSSAIAYLGDFQSGASRASLPITNAARILQVSPASGAIDLVAPTVASNDVPEIQNTGMRTFGRVIAGDAAQAAAAGAWAADLGWRRVATVDDGSAFGDTLAGSFTAAAEDAGVRVAAGGEDRYLAGTPAGFTARQGDRTEAVDASGVIASDAFLPPPADPLAAGAGRPSHVTSAALDPGELPAAGQDFAARFETEYGRAPGRYAAYGYEAMALILDSIGRASEPADRAAVVAAFFETEARDSILGPYSITERGETTLANVSGYELRGASPESVGPLEIP